MNPHIDHTNKNESSELGIKNITLQQHELMKHSLLGYFQNGVKGSLPDTILKHALPNKHKKIKPEHHFE